MIQNLEDWKDDVYDDISGTFLQAGRMIFRQLKEYRYFDEKKLIGFIDQLKDIEGQKYAFIFYQQLIIPTYDIYLDRDEDQDQLKNRISFNVEKIKRSFADSSVSVNLIFLTKTEQHQLDMFRMNPADLVMENISAETFSAFNEVAEATGGITDSSANMAASFQRAAISSENYYLLYYAPKNYRADGKFKNIKVKIKGNNYRVTHRAGYLAD